MNEATVEARPRWGIDNDYGPLRDVLLGRRAAAGLRPPIQTGVEGFRKGLGVTLTLWQEKKVPSWVTLSSSHKRRISLMASSVRGPRSSLLTPQASYSSGSSCPSPTAGKNRPWDR